MILTNLDAFYRGTYIYELCENEETIKEDEDEIIHASIYGYTPFTGEWAAMGPVDITKPEFKFDPLSFHGSFDLDGNELG